MRFSLVMVAVLLAGCGGGETAAHDGTTSSSGAGGAGGSSSASIATGAGGGDAAAATTSAGQGGAGGSIQPPECVLADDCPGTDNECRTRTCTAGKCGVDLVPAGTPLAQQTAGDCSTATCDGAGHVVAVDDPGDVAGDGTSCTVDACPGPTHTPVADGTACAENGGHLCNAGSCDAYIPVRCKIDGTATVYQACDGTFEQVVIAWSNGSCNGTLDEPKYCPPGDVCIVSSNGKPSQTGHCI